jgi:transposase InsO family protein
VWGLPSKLSTRVAEAFLGVMTRYGACAELLTDSGQEFAGVLCRKLLITHRPTSRYHPQSNGLTERLVRPIKGGITRFGTENDRRTLNEWLPYLVMGYRMSNQAALGGYSPYFLMHGRQPMLTGQAARQLLGELIDFDSPEQWVKACKQRAEVLKREKPLALRNLLAAQQRDQRRYEHVRKAGYRPRERKFLVEDLVYLRRQPSDSTDVLVSRGAYKVHQVGANGRMGFAGRGRDAVQGTPGELRPLP